MGDINPPHLKKEFFGKGTSVVRNTKNPYINRDEKNKDKKNKDVSKNDNYSISIPIKVAKIMGLKNKQRLDLMYYLDKKCPQIILSIPPLSDKDRIQKIKENKKFLKMGTSSDEIELSREIYKLEKDIESNKDTQKIILSHPESSDKKEAIKYLEGSEEELTELLKELKNDLNEIKEKSSS
ncbi:MAG: hypothetical protein ABFQ65_00080 [Nanoarchaeota archaeon]